MDIEKAKKFIKKIIGSIIKTTEGYCQTAVPEAMLDWSNQAFAALNKPKELFGIVSQCAECGSGNTEIIVVKDSNFVKPHKPCNIPVRKCKACGFQYVDEFLGIIAEKLILALDEHRPKPEKITIHTPYENYPRTTRSIKPEQPSVELTKLRKSSCKSCSAINSSNPCRQCYESIIEQLEGKLAEEKAEREIEKTVDSEAVLGLREEVEQLTQRIEDLQEMIVDKDAVRDAQSIMLAKMKEKIEQLEGENKANLKMALKYHRQVDELTKRLGLDNPWHNVGDTELIKQLTKRIKEWEASYQKICNEKSGALISLAEVSALNEKLKAELEAKKEE